MLPEQIGLWYVAMCALKAGEYAASSLKLILGNDSCWPSTLLDLTDTSNLFCIISVRSLTSPLLPYIWGERPLLISSLSLLSC